MSKEIVLLVGYNAAGKSTLVKEFIDQGYQQINRDEAGGSLNDLLPLVRSAVQNGSPKIVLDNTYPTAQQRAPVIALGKQLGVPVRCIHLTTSFEDCQLNACLRIVQKYDRLLQPEDFKRLKDPNAFPPAALFSCRKQFQNPKQSEGFSSVEKRVFTRTWPADYTNKALLLDYDGTLRVSRGVKEWPEDLCDVEILPGRKEKLQEYVKKGYRLLGVSNQSAVAKGLDFNKAVQCIQHTNRLLGIDQSIDFMICPHRIPPVSCYCRKPHPGIGAYFIWRYKLRPSDCLMIGDQTTDKTFAERCGFQFAHALDFFS